MKNLKKKFLTVGTASLGLIAASLLFGCINSNEGDGSGTSGTSLRTVGSTNPPGAGTTKVDVCHIPPGNPANAHTITVGAPAVKAHLAHGDKLGACQDKATPPADTAEY